MSRSPELTALSVLLHPEYDHRRVVRIAQRVEALGLGAFWYPDERFYRDTYIGLAACAVATDRIRIGPAVTDPYTRHPALTAVAMASLAELSAGRATLGIGAGISGFAQLGLRPRRAAIAIREAVGLIRRLWAGERVTVQGEFVSAHSLALDMPVASPPPVYIAGDGPATLSLAGEIADGVILMHCASAKIFRAKREPVARGERRRTAGARPRIVARLDVAVSEDGHRAVDVAKLRLGRYLWSRYPKIDYLHQHELTLPPELERRMAEAPFLRTHDLERFRFLADLIPDDLVRPVAVAGTPEQVREQIAEVFEAGADEVMAYPIVPRGMEVEQVIDLLAAPTRRPSVLAPA